MKNKNLKQKMISMVPKKYRSKIKNFYYDYFSYPIHNIKYKLYYGIWDFFDSIAIETTTYCNLRCEFCPNSKYDRGLLKNRKLMDTNLFKKIINDLAKIKYRGWVLMHFYGEPLSDERLPDLVEYIKKKLPKAKIQINTNGFLLNIPLYKKLIERGVDRFFITQYGKTMPPAIKEIFEYLKDKSKREKKIVYRTLGKDLGLSNRGGEIKVENVVDYERPICIYPNTSIHVDFQGNIVLCCNDYHSSVKLGNLKNESLLEIWNKPNYKNLRRDLRRKIFHLPICRKCVGLD